ncbi:cellulase family glycosylhydrolase [Ramlibacter sp. MAH-25]|uniref:Cellulase family glycosylhydrolase n=1 Tax=Ramlibacter pinisoli TaxID=2682844 RepID=A0A6N8IWF5_9BURK|nr:MULTISPECIES: cellulase family glycosylhydrolase [Ramlibacter]MBA2965464.1 cellulase family glycosylhydrolase [Ramlibacter sp. CGMCC 1.13660]MVQ30430.1 cellulase family glycosylhydrolase [Ramlibacter pinisoli]
MRVRRRLLLQAAAAGLAVPALPGCLWRESEARTPAGPAVIGTNLSGMEWAQPGLRRNASSLPHLHFSVPRKAEVAWLAAQGFKRNRLPFQWELLQPVLPDSKPGEAVRALVGNPGELHAGYAQWITDVLDAHAAVGATCILDLHNYGRYRDFRYGPDGSVPGLQRPTPAHRAFTEDPNATLDRIFALAPGATLTPAHLADVWTRAARRWKDHPGLAGYGLMNEPHDLPRPGQTTASEGGGEDLAIWPAFARAAVEAIRRVDAKGTIYVGGNEWSAAMSLADRNPGFPLAGDNLVYEVHLYLDAASSGHAFDYETEVRKGFSAGLGKRAIGPDTGVQRLDKAVRWADQHGVRLALTEVGLPPDDVRWQEMFQRTVAYAVRHGVEVQTWMAGDHWPIRGHPLGQAPGWWQGRTVPAPALGVVQQAAGLARAVLVDEAPGAATPGQPVTVTVQARGALQAPLTLTLTPDEGVRLDRTSITLPAGANPSASYTARPAADRVGTVRYSGPAEPAVPPPRAFYALQDPLALADRRLADAGRALLARWSACQWLLADAWTDYLQGAPARDGQPVRAVADSGFGSSLANTMEMLVALNTDSATFGTLALPVLRTVDGRRCSDHGGEDVAGFWCRKATPEPGVQPNPRARVPYDLQDEHFAIAVIATPGAAHTGVVFQASRAEDGQLSEIALVEGRPQARFVDARGQQVTLASPRAIEPGRPVVLTLASAQGAQVLRVDGEPVARAGATFAPSVFTQLLIAWGFVRYFPRAGFRGQVFAVAAGKGRPAEAELAVLERYLRAPAA